MATTTEQATSTITVYSTTWCPDCHRAKAYLNSKGVEYTEIDIEKQPDTAAIVRAHNNGKNVVPTFEIDGSYYGNPSLSDLGKLLAAR